MNIIKALTSRESLEFVSELLENDDSEEDELISNRPPISFALCDEAIGPMVNAFLGNSTERLSSFSLCTTGSTFMVVGRGGRGGGVFPGLVVGIWKD